MEDKQSALDRQRQEYEKQFLQLKSYMSPSTPYPPYQMPPFDPHARVTGGWPNNGRPFYTPTTPTVMSRLEKWGQQRYVNVPISSRNLDSYFLLAQILMVAVA